MVQFGLHLQQNARPEWQHSYINYDILKQHIEQIADATDDQGTLDLLKRKFQLTLDGEILKVVRRVGWARGQRRGAGARVAQGVAQRPPASVARVHGGTHEELSEPP